MAILALRDDMGGPSFEEIFAIDPAHQLVLIRSRSRAGAIVGQFWTHNEYSSGSLVAKYESFEEFNPASGARRSGWTKYDREGRLLKSGESLGPPL
jgi:hypothetical protein